MQIHLRKIRIKFNIADGHHRAAAVKVGQLRRKQHPDYDGSEEFNYFLSVLFPDEELTSWITIVSSWI